MKKLGFIGLGTMGIPMAQNLLRAGYEVTVYNRTAKKAKLLRNQGATIAYSLDEVAHHSEVIFTMLTDDAAVEEVILGNQGVIKSATKGLTVVDSSTISPKTSQRIAQSLAQIGAEMLDAPVTGSVPQAIEGILTFMVGGKRETFDFCYPLFKAMGEKVFYMGGHGTGCYTKLANNTIAAINLFSLSEGMTIASQAGIDPDLFIQTVSAGGARSGMAEDRSRKMIDRDFTPHFPLNLLYKDLRLANDLSTELQISTPVLDLVKEMLRLVTKDQGGNEDISALIKYYENKANPV